MGAESLRAAIKIRHEVVHTLEYHITNSGIPSPTSSVSPAGVGSVRCGQTRWDAGYSRRLVKSLARGRGKGVESELIPMTCFNFATTGLSAGSHTLSTFHIQGSNPAGHRVI